MRGAAQENATTGTTPRERYEAALKKPGFEPDAGQRKAVEALQNLHDHLLARPRRRGRGLSRIMGRSGPSDWPPVPGLYLWGPVGRGKTWLMDLFFNTLPLEAKLRTHFHRFLQDIHARRRRYRHEQDPLVRIAAELATDVRVLCFDEFFVEDVGDAMILGRLLDALFERGVTLVTTSNTAPDDLYAGGLQRERFLPAIELIKRHTRVMRLDNGEDYRLRTLTRAEIYHSPLDAQAERAMQETFHKLTESGVEEGGEITVNGRSIRCLGRSDNVVWFHFDDLCKGPRSAEDYIELARCHQTLMVSGIPQMGPADDNAARRLINLVDETYDRGVKLIVTAEAPPEALYRGKRLQGPFERTQSRLIEMQSREYLAEAHKAG